MKIFPTRLFLLSGLLIPVIFWCSTIVAGEMHGNYNHLRDTISELGGVGTNSEIFMAICTWICTVISVAFFISLVIICRQSDLSLFPLIGILGFSIMFGWAATFHSGNPLHSKAAPAAILMLAGPLLSLLLWKGAKLKMLRILSFLSLLIMLLIILRAIPSATIQNNYTGLIQRFVHLGWSIWFASISLTFISGEGGSVILTGSQKVEVSRRKKEVLMGKMTNCIGLSCPAKTQDNEKSHRCHKHDA